MPSVTAVVTKTLPPVTIGDDHPRPGIVATHSTFSVFDQRSGSALLSPTGFRSGPRNCGQSGSAARTTMLNQSNAANHFLPRTDRRLRRFARIMRQHACADSQDWTRSIFCRLIRSILTVPWSFSYDSFLWSNGSIMLQLDGTGPLHQQIYRAFRNEILSGAASAGRTGSFNPRPCGPSESIAKHRSIGLRATACGRVSRDTSWARREQLWRLFYHRSALLCGPRRRLACKGSVPARWRRLAIAGERFLKSARAGSQELGIANLDLGADAAAHALRFSARPCGVRRSAVCALVQAARLARPPCQPAGSRLRPAAGPPGAQRSHRHSPPTPARGRCRPGENCDCQRNATGFGFDRPSSIESWRPRADGGPSLHRRAVRIHVGGS